MIDEQRGLPRSGNIDLAPGTAGAVVTVNFDEAYGYDVYLAALGMDLAPNANEDFVTFQVRVNNQPFYPFENMVTRLAPSADPRKFPYPFLCGRNCKVDVYGLVESTATGTTTLAASIELILVPHGVTPDFSRR